MSLKLGSRPVNSPMMPRFLSARPVTVAHFSTYETMGGAAIAARRIHRNLRRNGVDSTLYVAQKTSADSSVQGLPPRFRRFLIYVSRDLDKLPLKRYPGYTRDYFSPGWFTSVLSPEINRMRADIVHLHWITHGYMSIDTIGKITSPMVWTLHDSWAFTGGCHIPADCKKYALGCGGCPILGDNRHHDLTSRILRKKKNNWKNRNITLVAPSRWMADCAGASTLFHNKKIRVIPHGVDTEIFKPLNKTEVRKQFSLPDPGFLILFGAYKATNDNNKGFDLLCESLHLLQQQHPAKEMEVIIFGTTGDVANLSIPYKCRYLGYLDEETLSRLYPAVDVMLVPSRQESFCQTAIEAMACGTPVVAFNATGPKDIIDHRKNGYLAEPYSTQDFADGIQWIIENNGRTVDLSTNAREKVETMFSEQIIIKQYVELYSEILIEKNGTSRH